MHYLVYSRVPTLDKWEVGAYTFLMPVKQKSLSGRLVAFLERRYPQWMASGDLQRIIAEKTDYTPRTSVRRLQELAEAGVLEVEQRENHAWYRYHLGAPIPEEKPLPVEKVAAIERPQEQLQLTSTMSRMIPNFSESMITKMASEPREEIKAEKPKRVKREPTVVMHSGPQCPVPGGCAQCLCRCESTRFCCFYPHPRGYCVIHGGMCRRENCKRCDMTYCADYCESFCNSETYHPIIQTITAK